MNFIYSQILFITLLTLGGGSLALSNVVDMKKEAKGYSNCKKQAVSNHKGNPKKIRAKVKKCRKKFPISKVIADCKKLVVKGSEKPGTCKKIEKFDKRAGESQIPFIAYNENIFVNGLDLSKNYDFSWAKKNENCSDLISSIDNFEKSKFFFYATKFKTFGIGSKKFKSKKKEVSEGVFQIEPLFRVESQEGKRLVYFPTGRCDFEIKRHKRIKAISHFFLIDYENEKLFPYTTLFFYKEKSLPKSNRIVSEVARRSFDEIDVVTKKDSKIFLANKKLKEFDEDGDPLNLCLSGTSSMVAVIMSLENSEKAQSSALTNIKSYCSYLSEIKSQFRRL